jgi:hypothetical protein
MGCACNKGRTTRKTYTYTAPDGSSKTYSTEIEAQNAVRIRGGSYKVSG